LRRREEERLERTEMRMLRWNLGLTLRDRKRNDDIRRILGVVCITDKVREARLRWYGHVQRQEEDSCVKRILEANAGGQRSRGRQRDGSTSPSTTWRTCSSAWRMQSIELNGEEEPVWLIPYLRDPQPEREREGDHIAYMLSALCYCPSVCPSFHLFFRPFACHTGGSVKISWSLLCNFHHMVNFWNHL